MVYLDYNATTPLASEVVEVITETLTSAWGNPSSSHEAGVKAKTVIATARQQVARMVGAKPSDIIFTSGGTEGNNWIFHSALQHFHKSFNNISLSMGDWNCDNNPRRRPHIITSNMEHDSIKLVLEFFQRSGLADNEDQGEPTSGYPQPSVFIDDPYFCHGVPFVPHIHTQMNDPVCDLELAKVKLLGPRQAMKSSQRKYVTFVPARPSTGCVDVQDIIDEVGPSTIMITVMLANNETGVIQPVPEICQRVKSLKRHKGDTPRILLHTDAAQAIGKIPVDVQDLGVDYLTIVGHKFYGPRVGAVFAHNPGDSTPLYPLLIGGGQERNFRPGTENTPMLAGLGKAAELVSDNLDKYQAHMRSIRDYLEESLQLIFGDSVTFNGKCLDSQRLPNTCNVSFLGRSLKGHEILARAPSVQASVGAACHAQDKPSHILLALGISESVAWRALRISVGRETTKEDIDVAVQELKSVQKDCQEPSSVTATL